jgi:hypothetical protein
MLFTQLDEVTMSQWTTHPFIFVGVVALTLATVGAIFLNIYLLIPRFLLRSRYIPYICSLLGLSLILILIDILSELIILDLYQLPHGERGYFGTESSLILYILSNIASFPLVFLATSVIVFLSNLLRTGKRIHELEEAGVRVELEKARTRIDSGALLDVLNQAASIAVSLPHEASRILLELGKSLRQQLYESDRKHFFSDYTEKSTHTFRERHGLLDFLIEKRYCWARHVLFVVALFMMSSSGFYPIEPAPFLGAGIIVGYLLALVYFNVYVLIPRFLFKNKWKAYLVAVFFIACVCCILTVNFETSSIIFWLISKIIPGISGILFLFFGTATLVIFQHWARNERYIAQLETSTMRAELEQLQNQINPHFLFNMLNNILVLIRENIEEAVVILHKMSDMLKYQFNNSTKKEVLLNDDIQFLTDFLNLEKIRRDRFEFTVTVDANADSIFVPPLLFIPFVENAVKHSADAANLSYIRLHFSAVGDLLHFTCQNSKPLKPRPKNEFSGLGLVNIRRRLELLYDDNFSLNVHEDETSYNLELGIINLLSLTINH